MNLESKRVRQAGGVIAALLAAATVWASPAGAQPRLAVVANDGKQPLLSETPNARERGPDTVSVIDIGRYPPQVLGTVETPVSMIGPPTSLAMSRDGAFAVVTAAQKFDPNDPSKLVPDSTVSLIDLTDPAAPKVLQTASAGAGATGVSINPAGTLALVANVNASTVSVFAIRDRRMTLVSTIALSAPRPGAGDVAISPDGKVALVAQRYGTKLWRLAIDGDRVTDTGVAIEVGQTPYGVAFNRDGRYAFNTNLGGRIVPPDPSGRPVPRPGTVTAVDLRTNRVASTTEVGATPEHVALSPDGKYLAVTVVNGSSARPDAPGYNSFGLLKVYRVNGGKLTLAAEARTAGWGQGSAFSDDNKLVLLQSALDKTIEVYRFDGKTLTKDPAATLRFATRPSTIVTPRSR